MDNGCRGVGPNGSLGEYSSLTDDERRKVVQVAVERGRRHAGSWSPACTASAGTRRRSGPSSAEDGRRDGVLLPAADHVPVRRPARSIEHFGEVAEVGLPVMVYNNPYRHQGRPHPRPGRRARRRFRKSLPSRSSPATSAACSRSGNSATSTSSPAPTTCCSSCCVDGATGWFAGYPNAFPKEAVEIYDLCSGRRSRRRRARCTSTWWPCSAGIPAPSSSRRSSCRWTSAGALRRTHAARRAAR